MFANINEGEAPTERRIARAADELADTLAIQPLRKSNIIQIRYASTDPALAMAVLSQLANHYLEKHLAVHRPSGAFAFFEHEAERYRSQLTLVRARLEQDRVKEGIVSVDGEKEANFRRILDLEATQQATQVQIAETLERIRAIEKQAESIPPRTTTEIRTASGRVIEQLQATMVPLELKRMELLRVFKPTYPAVLEADAQIEKLMAAIEAAKASPLVEEATNRDSTYDYLRTELARSRSELPALRARASATAQFLSANRAKARRLEQIGETQQTLLSEAKQAEENYIVYARKREEARISDALDAQRIVNVAIAEEATLPASAIRTPTGAAAVAGDGARGDCERRARPHQRLSGSVLQDAFRGAGLSRSAGPGIDAEGDSMRDVDEGLAWTETAPADPEERRNEQPPSGRSEDRLDLERLAEEETLRLVYKLFVTPDDRKQRVVLFAGVERDNGCAGICLRAARTLAALQPGPVCLVDANLRSPWLHELVGADCRYGLASAGGFGQASVTAFARPLCADNDEQLVGIALRLFRVGPRDAADAGPRPAAAARASTRFEHILICAPPADLHAESVALGKPSTASCSSCRQMPPGATPSPA